MALFETLIILGMLWNQPSGIQSPSVTVPAKLQALSEPLNGTMGNDILNGDHNKNTINGLNGDDTLNGKAGYDRLDGGDGKDTLDGGPGLDTLIGGKGKDIFRFRGNVSSTHCPSNAPCQINVSSDDGKDVIKDFKRQEDTIVEIPPNVSNPVPSQYVYVYGAKW
ncbi:MAG TPA: hypothetical protein V6D14_22175 [Coleofasciculaceae cyanobacterium]|jgi:Ca2+-binding RTX toxin-like protein